MATENDVVTPLTFEMIQAADAKTMSLWMRTRRPEVDAVLQAKSEELQSKVVDQNSRMSEIQQAQAQRNQEIEQEQERVRKERAEELERRRKLTPEERAAEDKAAFEAAQEQERIANEERVAEEKDKAYLSTLRPAERQAELKRREDEALAKETAAVEAAAAEQQRLADEAAAETAKAEKEAADKAAADKEVADRAAAEAAEQEKQLAEKQRIAAEEAARPKQKVIVDYQATDDEGNPIGRPTHLEADSWEEMSKKQQDAHVNAVRYAERMKKQASRKPIPARQVAPLKILTEEERTALEKEAQAGEGTKAEIARIKLEQDLVNQEIDKERKTREWNRQNDESKIFVAAHVKDFYPCQANAQILADYITAENLDWNSNNLEIAFSKLSHKLAPRPEEVVIPAPANPAPAPPVISAAEIPAASKTETPQPPPADNPPAAPVSVVAPVVAPVAPPIAPTPAETPVQAADNPPAPVKRPASGIEPGSLHGGRRTPTNTEPVAKSASEIKREIARMPLDAYKKRLKDPKFRALLNSVGINA